MGDKHAYLIIAHDNFHVLRCLIELLDDSRNDIYLHIDKKVKYLPDYTTKYAKLKILNKRLDVRWGDVSQIECEYVLFEEAYNSDIAYCRYNLISGTHFPIKTQDEIHDFLNKNSDSELLTFLYTNDYEINFKLGYYHFFLNYYRYGRTYQQSLAQKLWQICLKIQKVFNIGRPLLNVPFKANNWISITPDALNYIISQKQIILKRFKRTFCGDEYFIPYLLKNNLNFRVIDEPLLLYNDFEGGSNPKVLDKSDVDILLNSDYLFARKFADKNIEIIDFLVSKKQL